MIRIIGAIVLFAHAPILLGQQPNETEAPSEEASPRAAYATAVADARAAREAAIRDAKADYERVARAVRSASASLTEDARRRLETGGPLAAARQARAAALVDIEATYDRAMGTAARGYTPAADVILTAVNDAVAFVRTELEVYEAVMAVAAEALDSRQSAASGSARQERARESDYSAAVADRDEAQRALDAAIARRDRISRNRPDPDAYKPSLASSVLGGLGAAVAEAGGAQGAIESFKQQDGQAREQGTSSYLAADQAWEAEWEQARSEVEAARRVLDADASRAAQASAQRSSAARSTQDASRQRAVALKAREAAKYDAAMVSSVLDWTEFGAVEAVLRKTAVSVVADVDTEALNTVTSAGAADALRAALDRYKDLRLAALDAALAAIEAEKTNALETARVRLKNTYDTEALRKARELEAACTEAQAGYEQALERADQALDTALAAFQSLAPNKRNRPKNRASFQTALARHAAATNTARSGRVNAIARRLSDAGGLASVVESELAAAVPADSFATGVERALSAGGDTAAAISEHREHRRHTDIVFRAALLGEYQARLELAVPERVAEGMETIVEEAEQRAESARRQLVDQVPQLVDHAEALRRLEDDVRDGLSRAAQSGSAIAAFVESTLND